jgi:DNA-binding LytR/AlgR family response regulator
MNKIRYPNQSEIIFLEGETNYTFLHLNDGKTIISSFTLMRHQEKLGHFLRVSKKHLVNPDYILEMHKSKDDPKVKLIDGKELKISRRRIELISNKLMNQK